MGKAIACEFPRNCANQEQTVSLSMFIEVRSVNGNSPVGREILWASLLILVRLSTFLRIFESTSELPGTNCGDQPQEL
jgi:hypothetical protein